MTNEMKLAGKTPNEIYNEITKQGVSEADAALIVSGWIYQNFGKVKHVFNYTPDFMAVDAACVPHFAQSFHHADWVDGEDVVQAGQTPGEDGFNLRFHRIETDLGSLAADVGRAFAALADMRQQLHTLLDEIRTEINRINSDVFDCCTASQPAKLPPYGTVVKNPIYLGAIKYNGKDASMWQTEQGPIILPSIDPIAIDIRTNPRVDRISNLVQYVEDNRDVRAGLNQPFTTKEFINKFGNMTAPNGEKVSSLVQILPDDAQFKNVDDMVSAVTERETAALRTSGDAPALLAATLGPDVSKGAAQADVNTISTIPETARMALAKAGINTIDKLSTTDSRQLQTVLANAGVTGISAGQVASWGQTAKVLKRLG